MPGLDCFLPRVDEVLPVREGRHKARHAPFIVLDWPTARNHPTELAVPVLDAVVQVDVLTRSDRVAVQFNCLLYVGRMKPAVRVNCINPLASPSCRNEDRPDLHIGPQL